jgi:2-dehydro-3-deoxygluconokinase
MSPDYPLPHPSQLALHDAVCIGEAMALVIPDPPWPLRHADTFRLEVAGAESNVSIYLSMLGARAAWVSRVGEDPLGDRVLDRIRNAGVDTTMVDRDPAAPTGVFFKDPRPDGTKVHYYRRGSAAAGMDRAMWSRIADARLVHLSGVTPALSASCADLVMYGLMERPVRNATMSFDVNYRPGLWTDAVAGPVLADLANQADVVFVGLDEASACWGCRTPSEVREVLPGPATVVVKDGPVGATSFGPEGRCFVAASIVDVVETVGAGDAFAAGYLYGVLRNLDEKRRIRLGHLMAASALRSVGDIGERPAAEAIDEVITGGRHELR